MTQSRQAIRVAIVGLGFGSHWIEAYRHHPDVASVGICDANAERLAQVGEQYGIDRRHVSLDEVINSDQYDAIHLFTAIPDHAQQSIRVLRTGKHCACAIPMAITYSDARELICAERESGKNYMLMETECFSATYLYVKQLYDHGAFGTLQFMRACHYQNMDGWPSYWRGLPPMYYCYHGLGPVMEIHGRRAVRVQALGSGTRQPEMADQYGNAFPIETAMIQFEGLDAVCELTSCLYKMARGFSTDRFSLYGDKLGFESAQYGGEAPMFFDVDLGPLKPGQSRAISGRRQIVPALESFVAPECSAYMAGLGDKRFAPMVHEFIRSIVEARPSIINAQVAARWTSVALCAHDSAMNKGEPMAVSDPAE